MSLLPDAGRGHDAAAPLGVRTDQPPRLFIVAVVYLPGRVEGGGDLAAELGARTKCMMPDSEPCCAEHQAGGCITSLAFMRGMVLMAARGVHADVNEPPPARIACCWGG